MKIWPVRIINSISSEPLSVLKALNIDLAMRLVVDPFENFIRVRYNLIRFIRPNDRLKIFVVGNWRGSIPDRLEAIY